MQVTREAVVALIHKQLDRSDIGQAPQEGPFVKPYNWHYGKQELRELIDFIYGKPPENQEQEIRKDRDL